MFLFKKEGKLLDFISSDYFKLSIPPEMVQQSQFGHFFLHFKLFFWVEFNFLVSGPSYGHFFY